MSALRNDLFESVPDVRASQENMAEADSKWCRIRGVVHTAREQDGRTILEIGAGAADVSIQLPVPVHSDQLLDREVAVTGVFGVLFNDRRQAIGHQIFVPSPQFLKVVDAGVGRSDPVRSWRIGGGRRPSSPAHRSPGAAGC